MWAIAFLATALAAPFPFTKKTNYDENEARMLLNLAAAAYGLKHDDCLAKTFPHQEDRRVLSKDMQICDHLDSTCESYVVTSDTRKELIVVFRGTKTKTQLLLEGWDSLQPGVDFFDMGNVNRYFLNAHLKLWPDVEQALQNTQHNDYKLVFTGHSLGGALATLAAARVVRQGYRTGDQVKLLTFGQPRVGSLEFATNFDNMIKESYRVVFRRDIVPHLPTCAKAEVHLEEESQPCDPTRHDKAYHHGTEIWYPDEMSRGAHYVECTGNPKNEDFECSDRIKFRYDQWNSYIWDHRHYFGVRVPEYGKSGCDATQPEGKPGVIQNLLCWISPAPNCEDHKLSPEPQLPVVPLEIINRPWSINNEVNGSSGVFLSLFVLASCRYNETEARMLLQMAAGAYGDGSDINDCMMQALPPSDTHRILSVSAERCDSFNNPCEGYIVSSYNAQTLFVVFRGTKTDLQLLLEGFSTLFSGFDFYGMGLVNRYFLNGHDILWNRINETLNDPLYRNFRVIFTGHSLGGALAALAAARTVREGYRRSDQVKLVTFGEPRTGTAEFAFNFDRLVPESYRVVFRMDLVPHMPACAKDKSNPLLTSKDSLPCDPNVLDKAYHHGTEIWYPESMTPGSHYIECTGLPKNEDFGCSDQFKFHLKERNMYIWDHRHYFDVGVPTFGQAGCDLTLIGTKRRKRAL